MSTRNRHSDATVTGTRFIEAEAPVSFALHTSEVRPGANLGVSTSGYRSLSRPLRRSSLLEMDSDGAGAAEVNSSRCTTSSPAPSASSSSTVAPSGSSTVVSTPPVSSSEESTPPVSSSQESTPAGFAALAAASSTSSTRSSSTTPARRLVQVTARDVHISIVAKSGSVTVSAQVVDPLCTKPVVGITVNFVVPTLVGQLKCTGVTDSRGSAGCNVKVGRLSLLIPGTYYSALTQATQQYASGSALGRILQ